MTFLSLSFHRSERAICQPRAGTLEACYFERQLFPGRALVGGTLAWLPREGTERRLVVAMTWDILAELRLTLEKLDRRGPDDVIIRSVLCHWGLRQYREQLHAGVLLPAEGLVLQSLGGPSGCQARRLLEACGLLTDEPPVEAPKIPHSSSLSERTIL